MSDHIGLLYLSPVKKIGEMGVEFIKLVHEL